MSRLFHYFKNREVRKEVKNRIEMWVVSERLKDTIPAALLQVK